MISSKINTLGSPNKALAKTALSAGVAGIKDGTSEGGTYNMDGTTYDGNGIAVGVDSLPPMTAKQITDEKVETFRQKFMQGHKPWEKIGLFKFPEDRYASVDFTLILPKERLELAKKIGIYTRQHSIYDIETDELIELGFSGKNNKNLNGHELAVVRKIIADLSKRPSSPEDIREAQEIVDYIVKNGHSINTMVWRNIHKADKDLRDEKNKQHPKVVEAAIQAKARLISMDEFTEIVREYNPPQAITEPPVTATLTDLVQALDINKVAKKRILGLSGINIRDGEVVSFRLDIPAYNNFDIWVNTIKPAVGAPIYSNISVGNSAIFKHDVKKALKVAEGGAKTPFAVIDVIWENQTVEQTEREIDEALEDSKRKGSTWKQIGFNPQRSGYFYDKATFLPVASADRILQVGPLVMAKNVQYVGKEDTNVSFHGTSTPNWDIYQTESFRGIIESNKINSSC